MQALLKRASDLEPKLKIWVTLNQEAALETAGDLEQKIATRTLNKLHGIPLGIKDIFFTKGIITTACSPIHASFVPSYDATAVALLRDAGAIIMGKTVTTEFACMDPSPTLNPWNPTRTPGGSSSGSAVGVAARIFPAALGSQTAGSVLRPASYNGVVGMKPTFGSISRYGVFPVAHTLDTIGFFTRTVVDSAEILSVLSRPDHKDLTTAYAPTTTYSLTTNNVKPPRIGVLRQMFEDKANSETLGHLGKLLSEMEEEGATILEIRTSADFDSLLAAHKLTMSAECASVHKSNFFTRPKDYGPQLTLMIESGLRESALDYIKAAETQRTFRRFMEEAIKNVDVLITPSTPTEAPADLSTTGDPVFQTPWTVCGFPAISIPSGFSQSGLPLGIQLAARPWDEATLFKAAQWCERTLDLKMEPAL
jgi:Asp-tRNA(Asn)/Glu-tRNA(Gln) amidotransferase A subunit family amidase